jgi:hypothetical protein
MEENIMTPQKRVQQNFEIEEKTLKQLKKIAEQDERSVSYVFRKLAEQAIQAGTYQLVPPVSGTGIKRGSKV